MITIRKGKYRGTITPPSSKSDTHRAIISAALSKEECIVNNVSFSNDIDATIASLRSLGARIDVYENTIITHPIDKIIDEAVLNVNESGSTLRFLIPLSLVFSKKNTFILKGNLINRPITSYEKAFKAQDITIDKTEDGYIVQGSLKSGIFEIEGNVSSQFISGLLFSLPLLEGDSKIIIKNTISSLNYILMTIDTLNRFGIKIDFDSNNQIITIKGNQEYHSTSYNIENDYSQASFFLALGLINDIVKVNGMNRNSYQADKNIIEILRRMGGKIEVNDDSIISYPSQINECTVSLDENPDLGPILFGLAAFSNSKVTFTSIKRLRIKESDRVEAMRYNLELLGIKVEIIDEDTLVIFGGKMHTPNKPLSSFHDHRIFMTLCIITSHLDEITIDDETCINKSYPNFLKDFESLRKEILWKN